MGTPARLASDFIAAVKSTFSERMTNEKTSPPVAQEPKQRHFCVSGKTTKEGVRSW